MAPFNAEVRCIPRGGPALKGAFPSNCETVTKCMVNFVGRGLHFLVLPALFEETLEVVGRLDRQRVGRVLLKRNVVQSSLCPLQADVRGFASGSDINATPWQAALTREKNQKRQ